VVNAKGAKVFYHRANARLQVFRSPVPLDLEFKDSGEFDAFMLLFLWGITRCVARFLMNGQALYTFYLFLLLKSPIADLVGNRRDHRMSGKGDC
jgi:hypothetical protein